MYGSYEAEHSQRRELPELQYRSGLAHLCQVNRFQSELPETLSSVDIALVVAGDLRRAVDEGHRSVTASVRYLAFSQLCAPCSSCAVQRDEISLTPPPPNLDPTLLE